MKILVSGDEMFNRYKLMKKKLNALTVKLSEVVVVTLCRHYYVYEAGATYAIGADALAQRWACEWAYTYMVSNERKLEQRIEEVTNLAKVAIIFYGGKDKETKQLIRACKDKKLDLRIVRY